MNMHKLMGLLGLTLLLGAGCTGTPPADSAAEACDALSRAGCARLAACTPGVLANLYTDVDTCVARTRLSCQPALQLAGTGASAQQYKDCAAALATASCGDIYQNNLPAACRPAGSLITGAVCGTSAQCQSSSCRLTAGGCGKCTARAKAGEACQAADCEVGLVCSQTARCVAPAPESAVCASDQPCQFGLVCKAGLCAKAGEVGATCVPAASNCSVPGGLYCSGASMQCEQIQYAKAGEACGVTMGGIFLCGGGSQCDTVSGMASGICKAPAKDGEACNIQMSLGCQSPATCVSGVCKVNDPALCK